MRKFLGSLCLFTLLFGFCWANELKKGFDTAEEAKAYVKSLKTNRPTKYYVTDPNYKRPPTLSELIYKGMIEGNHRSLPLIPPRELPAEAEKIYGDIPVGVSYQYGSGRRELSRIASTGYPEDYSPSSTMAYGGFDPWDVLVSIPSTRPNRQPAMATDTFGNIYVVWGEEFPSGVNAIMFSKSTDGGVTWSNSRVLDSIGTNFMPRIAVYSGSSPSNCRVHVAYNYIEMHIYDVYDTNGTYLGQDTTYEGDVYYVRSTNSGSSFSSYYPIANNDLDLIIFSFHYDEGGCDVAVDGANDVAVAYYSQAEEGHLLSLALLLLYIILTGGLPPFWFDYTWYTVCYRGSPNGGSSFNGEADIVNDWFDDNYYPAIGCYGAGSSAQLHCGFAHGGFLSLMEAEARYKKVSDPFAIAGGPSVGSEVPIWDGYVSAGGCAVDSRGNPRFGVTDDYNWTDYNIYYSYSTNGGNSFIDPPIDVQMDSRDAFEPQIAIDLADNTFLSWPMEETPGAGDYSIYVQWSEDGGVSLRADQYKVNHGDLNDAEYWPDISLYLPYHMRRLDCVWWETRMDPDGDIYYNSAKWWRSNVVIQRHDPAANPMGGTVTITFTSFGDEFSRNVGEGTWIVYHDSGTVIRVTGRSTGSNASERWHLNPAGSETTIVVATPGQTFVLTYYDQYYATFTAQKGNGPACTHTLPTGIHFRYPYFAGYEDANTVVQRWANVVGTYTYDSVVTITANERWHTPNPSGLVTSFTISPTYYHQWLTAFKTPHRLNNCVSGCCCTHPVPSFTLAERYADAVNVGGTTDLSSWSDCGSFYRYQNPRNVSLVERWYIPEDSASGTILGPGPYEPGAYHQWKPTIILVIGEGCGTAWTDEHWNGGVPDIDVNLTGVYSDWTDCASTLRMSQWTTGACVAQDPYIFPCVTSAMVATIRYGDVVMVTLRNNFTGGFIIADGDTYSSPAVLGWSPGSTHEISAISPQQFGSTRYVFDQWNFGSTNSTVNVVATSETTFIAQFHREHYLDIVSSYGSPWGEGWYREGTTANFGVRAVDSVGMVRYRFLGWTSTEPGGYTGPDSSRNVTMNNPITETANWRTEFKIVMTYTGTPIPPVMSGEGWYRRDTTNVAISTDSILGDDGTSTDSVRYVFDHWESYPTGAVFGCGTCAHTYIALINQPYTIRAVYRTEYRLWITSLYDAPNPSAGAHWRPNGSNVTAVVNRQDGAMYCTGWTGTGSVPPTGVDTTLTFTITQPSSITWNWGDMIVVVVHALRWNSSAGRWDTVDNILTDPAVNAVPPPGPHYYPPGSSVWFKIRSRIKNYGWPIDWMRDTCLAWQGFGGVCSGADSCGGVEDSFQVTLNNNARVDWLWRPQFRLTISCTTTAGSGCSYDTPIPPYGQHWIWADSVINVRMSSTSSGTMVCAGFFASFAGYVPSYSYTFTMNAGASVKWYWIDRSEAESLIVYSDHGVPYCSPAVGVNYIPRGWTIPVSTILYENPDTTPGTRHQCIGWRGDTTGFTTPGDSVSGSGNSFTLTMDVSGWVRWIWQTQHRVRIECVFNDSIRAHFDTPVPDTGNTWWPNGALTSIFVRNRIDTTAADSLIYCIGWRPITGTCVNWSVYDTTSDSFAVVVNCPITIRWRWTDYMIPLYVYSDHGSPTPCCTTYWFPGSNITAFVSTPADVDTANGIRWRSIGWTGTGSVPPSGTGTAVNFIINDTSSITWNWYPEYRVRVNTFKYPDIYGTDIGYPSPGVGDHWYSADTTVTFRTHDISYELEDTFYCVGLYGTGCIPAEYPMTSITVPISSPGTLLWRWYPDWMVTHLTVISLYDSPFPSGTTHWLIGDTVNAHVDSIVIIGGSVIGCVGWTGTGDSLPPSGSSHHVNFKIFTDCTLTWNWANIYTFTVNNPEGWGIPHPPVGTYVHAGGDYVSGYMDSVVFYDVTGDTHYCVGYFGTGDLPPVSPQTDFSFYISQNSSVTWRWADFAYRLDVYSLYGSPHPYGTTYWIPNDSVYAYVDATVPLGEGVRARCVGWTGTGSVPPSGTTNAVGFRINANSTLTWRWVIEYAFVVNNTGGWDTPVPPAGTHWYQAGDTIVGYITTNPVYNPSTGDSMYCIGFIGTGDLPDTSHQTDFEFVITQPTTCTWLWYPEDTVVRLTVISAHDNPYPYGTTYWLIGQFVEAVVQPLEVVDSTRRYACTGFDVIGAIDTTDTSGATYISFIIDTHTTITWNWIGQFYISIDYDGLPEGCIPELLGEGWYDRGDSAEITAESPVLCSGSEYFGFVNWGWTPHNITAVRDSFFNHTFVYVDDAYALTAHYAPGVRVVVRKEPLEDNVGWILIDDFYHDSTSQVSTWWGQGSHHIIGVGKIDTTIIGSRYIFTYWSDGLDTVHWVGPIMVDTQFIAYYSTQHRATFTKNPVHRTGYLIIDGDTIPDSTYIYGNIVWVEHCDTFGPPPYTIICDTVPVCADSLTTGCSRVLMRWWAPGSTHRIKTSISDSVVSAVDTARLIFRRWDRMRRIGTSVIRDSVFADSFAITMEGPGYFTATYTTKLLLLLKKSPPEPYGWLRVNDSTAYYVARHKFWVDMNSTPTVGASQYDINDLPTGTDTVYVFQNWSDGGARIHTLASFLHPDSLTAFYIARACTVKFHIENYLGVIPDSFIWRLDSLENSERVVMVDTEVAVIVNDGNVPIDMGLMIQDATGGWIAVQSSSPGPNAYCLLGRFNDSPTPPLTTQFSVLRDALKQGFNIWATDSTGSSIFGPGGVNIMPPPATGTERRENLWMKFIAPDGVTTGYPSWSWINVIVRAKYHLP